MSNVGKIVVVGRSEASTAGWGGGTSGMLCSVLLRLDGQQYPKYHSIETIYNARRGGWSYDFDWGSFFVSLPRAQSDPFAAPTRVRVFVPSETAKFPKAAYSTQDRARALADYCLRAFHTCCVEKGADEAQHGEGWSGPKGGDLKICAPGQNVLDQSAVRIDKDGNVTAQFTLNLPARGRSILGHVAAKIFSNSLPEIVRYGLLYASHDPAALQNYILSIEDQADLRKQLGGLGLISFIGNGSILPRSSGADDRPMCNRDAQPIVAFQAPPSTLVKLHLKNAGRDVYGMGISAGVTVIVGGGFHGKSTLLNAIQLGVYDKVPGDGRELIVTVYDAVKIQAEDGRQLHSVNISAFISNLPFGRSTVDFTTSDASGSTSQAANVMEALELGAKVLIFDEDTCATNFMIRDSKMAALVNTEPITPYISRVTHLFQEAGVSSILVVGGAGDYLNCADRVLKMDNYTCCDVTQDAKAIVMDPRFISQVPPCASSIANWCVLSRFVKTHVLKQALGAKCSVRAMEKISFGDQELRLHGLDQLVTQSQTVAILAAFYRMAETEEIKTLIELIRDIEMDFDTVGVTDALNSNSFDGTLARPRRFEIAAALCRLRAPGVLHSNI